MTTMTTLKQFTVATVPQYLAAVTGYTADPKYREEEVAKYRRYKGSVLRVVEEEREIRMSDYSDYYLAVVVTVWDAEQGKALTFDAYTLQGNARLTLWEVDADYGTIATYNEWVKSVAAREKAKAYAEDARKRVLNRGEEELSNTLTPSLQRGQVWTVCKGRKFPIGAKGRVFWWGTNRWGMTVGLATTDRKDAKGKNLDVIFVAVDNLEYIPTEADLAKAEEIKTNYAEWAAVTEQETYERVYERTVNELTI